MKNSHLLLSIVSLSLTVIGARATTLECNNEPVLLPIFTVETPRQTAAERQIAHNLDELRALARVPLAIKTEIPLLKARNEADRETARPATLLVVSKS